MARARDAGQTLRQIAAALDRAPSTIMRELRRNRGAQASYAPAYAQQQTRSRRWRGSRLLRQPALQAHVLHRLGLGWSPAQVAGRLKRDGRALRVSSESIYQFIANQIRRTKDDRWRHY